MGFSSIDNYLNQTTNLGVAAALQTAHYEWNKITTGTFLTKSWHDLNLFNGNPPSNYYGEMTVNGGPYNSAWGWTVGSNWAYTAGNPGSFTHTATNAATVSQPMAGLVNGVTYIVIYTVSAFTSGTVTVSLNGTAGTSRGSAATFVESIVAGASGGLAFTPSTTAVLSINQISVIYPLQSYQLIDTNTTVGALYHGGNVTPATKHIINAGAITTSSTGVPGVLMLCDFLLAYPGINLNSTSPQTLLNSNALPRYTNGVGVRAYMTYAYGSIPATLQNINVSYTNTVPTSGQTLSSIVTNQGAFVSTVGEIANSGVLANNYNPFLPLYAGDLGMTQVNSVTLSAAGTASTYAAIILCKPLLEIPLTTQYILSERNFVNQLPSMPRIYDGAYLGWLYFAGAATAAASTFSGYLDVAWGS